MNAKLDLTTDNRLRTRQFNFAVIVSTIPKLASDGSKGAVLWSCNLHPRFKHFKQKGGSLFLSWGGKCINLGRTSL